MQSLPEVLSALDRKTTRALFLAFDVDAPFFDHDILPAILNDGLSDVTILVDAISIRDGAADIASTRKAGVYYRIEGVRPVHGKLFHPKLILLEHSEGVDVMIASANLTWTGWCRNLEVADVHSFGMHGHSSPAAARSIAEFLSALPSMLSGVSPEAIATMERAAAALLAAADKSPSIADTDDCAVFSNLHEPLLDQLQSIASPSRVSKLVGVSPFFDPTNTAVLRFATVYGSARVEVIKDGLRANDFDGKSFAKLGKRAVLRQTQWDDAPRPLHAKAIFLGGEHDAWLVTGSANLTTPAWLKSVGAGGNVELISVRHATGGPRSAAVSAISERMLLAGVETDTIPDPTSVQYIEAEGSRADDGPMLQVYDAHEEDSRLVVRWEVRNFQAVSDEIRLSLRSQDREAAATFTAHREDDGWSAEINRLDSLMLDVLDDEIAVLVRVEQETDCGTAYGLAWLRRTGLLGQGPRTLLLRHRIRALANPSSARPEDILHGVAALLEAARADAAEFEIGDFEDDENEAADGAVRTKPRRGPLNQTIRALVMPSLTPSRPISKPKRVRDDNSDSQNEDEDAADEADPLPPADFAQRNLDRAVQLANSLRSLTEVVSVYARRSLDNPSNDRFHLSAAGALLGGLRAASISIRQPWLDDAAEANDERLREPREMIRHARQALWHMAFSIEGWEAGTCRGWFTAMSLTPQWSRLATATLNSTRLVARVLVDLAASTANEGNTQIPSESLFAIQLLTDVSLPPRDELASYITAECKSEDPARGQENAVRYIEMLKPAAREDLRGWARLRDWMPLFDVLVGRQEASVVLLQLPVSLLRPLSAILRRPDARNRISGVSFGGDHPVCAKCRTILSPMCVAMLRKPEQTIVHCESCSAVLIPIDPLSPMVSKILDYASPEPLEDAAVAPK